MAASELRYTPKHLEVGEASGNLPTFTPEQQRFLFRNFDILKAVLQDGVTQDVTMDGTTLEIRHGIVIGVT